MKRTTIYLEPDLELLLKQEASRRKTSMAELIREALRDKLEDSTRPRSRHGGAFASGHSDTAERTEAVLAELGFGEEGER